ncbi:MAG: indole-3-glycerol phosphate synthase TrpC [Nitrospirae bacterium]|nr:indole-3-glycerol phosphate synthase TrpC [Nitrospirota bacterium]
MGILDEIVKKKKERLSYVKAKIPLKDIISKIPSMEKPRPLMPAIKRDSKGIRLIAEIKKASPSRGIIRQDFNHMEIAKLYQEKSDAISVLTEEDFFMGDLKYIEDVREIVDKPLLRKDFIVDEYQLYESRANRADAILLIASLLSKAQAEEYLHMAKELSMAVLFEIHDMRELEMALLLNADIIGINNRDLKTLKIDLSVTETLKKDIPEGKIVVSESGIKSRQDVIKLDKAGIDAMLIGTVLMEAENIGKKIDELRGKC